MRCFYHGDVEAVAVCKSCGRGICHDCYAEVGTGTACRNRCESEVATLEDLQRRMTDLVKMTGQTYYGLAVFLALIGGALLLLAAFSYKTTEKRVSAAGGAVFLAGAVACGFLARRADE